MTIRAIDHAAGVADVRRCIAPGPHRMPGIPQSYRIVRPRNAVIM